MTIALLLMLGVMFGITVVGWNSEAPSLTKYIREKDVLKQWPMSKATLIRARKKGLPFTRLGAYICYRPEDLEAHFCQPRSWKAATPNGKGDKKNG